MAYIDTFTIYDVPVICTGSGTHGWISADFKIVGVPNFNNTAYNVYVYARIDANGYMEWDGTCRLVAVCNGKTASANISLAMYNGSEGALTKWDGPASFSLGAPGDSSLVFSTIKLDLTTTTGTNGLPGIWHTTDDGNMTEFTVNNYTIKIGDGGLKPLLSPPVIDSLTNVNPYNNKASISEFTDKISLSWNSDIDVVSSKYRINGGSWININSSIRKVIIYDLSPGTSYKIDVYSSNAAGNSNTLSTTIRTRYLLPETSMTLSSKSIDQLVFTWKSNRTLASTQYKINADGTWINANSSGDSGTFSVDNLEPNTKYIIFFRGTTSDSYDSLTSNEIYNTYITHNIAKITDVTNFIFGDTWSIDIDHPSNRNIKLTVYAYGNSREAEFTLNSIAGNNLVTPTQEQLDNIYKCYSNVSNYLKVKFTLTTIGGWKSYTYTRESQLRLTGIVKTAHINKDGVNKRTQGYVNINGVIRRAIFWIGDENGNPRRCI